MYYANLQSISIFLYWCNFHIDPVKGRLFKNCLKMLGRVRKYCIETP